MYVVYIQFHYGGPYSLGSTSYCYYILFFYDLVHVKNIKRMREIVIERER